MENLFLLNKIKSYWQRAEKIHFKHENGSIRHIIQYCTCQPLLTRRFHKVAVLQRFCRT